ncbi:MAG: hypothetical protein ACK4UY_03750 [Dietzia sp.]
MSAHDAIERKLDAEDAEFSVRYWNAELDRLLVEMRRDADWLEEHWQFAGATLTRRNADQIQGALGRIRDAGAILGCPHITAAPRSTWVA